MPMNIEAPTKLAVGRVRFFGQHRGEVNCSAFSPDGHILLTAADDGCVYVWETRSRRLLWRMAGHSCVYVWETRSRRLLWRMAGHRGPVKFCRFSRWPPGCQLLWDVTRFKCLHVLRGHQQSVETVSFSPDSRQLASGGWDRRLILWEVQSGHNVRLLAGHRDSVQSSDFSPTANTLATGSWDSTVHIWDLRWQPQLSPTRCWRATLATSAAYATQHLASWHLAPGTRPSAIWKPTTSSLLFQLKGHATWVKSLDFSPDELRLASAVTPAQSKSGTATQEKARRP